MVEVDHMDQRPANGAIWSGVLYRDAFHELLMQGMVTGDRRRLISQREPFIGVFESLRWKLGIEPR